MDKLKFALHVKGLSIPLYEKVFDIEYPLPKLDTLAVRDFNGEPPLGFSPLVNPPSDPKCFRGYGELGPHYRQQHCVGN